MRQLLRSRRIRCNLSGKRCRSPGATRPRRAGPAIGRAEACVDEGTAGSLIPVLAPARALMALGAAHAALVPLHREVGGEERTLLHLPALVRSRRADQLDPMLLAGAYEVFGTDVARVGQVLSRGQPLGL